MDRIYYFMLAKDEAREKNKKRNRKSEDLPIFCKEIGVYEVYYLQMYAEIENSELAAAQAHMAKGIRRVAQWYGRDEESVTPYLVFDRDFAKWLQMRQREEYWQKLWNLPLYSEYKEAHNLTFLLQQLPVNLWPRQLIILGDAPGMQDWIGSIVRHMKGITVFSPMKPRGFETVREKLLEEYGLLADWEKSLQPAAQEPALILDYSGKEKIYVWGIPRGSIWIDMTSMEERRHALEDRDTGIQYISLKSFWQGEMLQTLDTVSKIQYNTEVKLEGKVGL